MSEAARLRAQKAYSTDPEYLERMALAEEARAVRARAAAGSPSPPGSSPLTRPTRQLQGN
jgi:hypothetical protein